MNALETLREYVVANGVMFTVRFIVERDEWFGILHLSKIDSVDAYRANLDDMVTDLVAKANKLAAKGLEFNRLHRK